MTEITVNHRVLDAGLPAHMLCDPDGTITRAGPTLQRMRPDVEGAPLSQVLAISIPDILAEPAALVAHFGQRLMVDLLPSPEDPGPPTKMRAVAFPVGHGQILLNCFFGTDVLRGVARHELTARHFAPFDPTMELLFVMEARDVVLAEFERLNTRLEDARNQAEQEAVTDALTGLLNRRALDDELATRRGRRAAPYALMHLDLDYFKSVNDTFGHAAGDHVLERVGQILRAEIRRDDLVARVGGDEFVLVFNNCDDVALMRSIAARIISQLEEPILFEGNTCHISGSIGVTLSSFYTDPQPDQMMADADAALYTSKNEGRARCNVAKPGHMHAP